MKYIVMLVFCFILFLYFVGIFCISIYLNYLRYYINRGIEIRPHKKYRPGWLYKNITQYNMNYYLKNIHKTTIEFKQESLRYAV